MTNLDQFFYESGYFDGLTGGLPNHESPACLMRRFAYIAGWRVGYRAWVANQEVREVTMW